MNKVTKVTGGGMLVEGRETFWSGWFSDEKERGI
jgi:hypothetical protein